MHGMIVATLASDTQEKGDLIALCPSVKKMRMLRTLIGESLTSPRQAVYLHFFIVDRRICSGFRFFDSEKRVYYIIRITIPDYESFFSTFSERFIRSSSSSTICYNQR